MVSLDSMNNLLVFTVLVGNFNTKLDVRALSLCCNRLTDIVKKSGSRSPGDVNAHLVCHNAGKHRNLYGVAKSVLTVRGTVFHSAKQLYKLGMKSVHARFKNSLFSRLLN